jgi:putative transposase
MGCRLYNASLEQRTLFQQRKKTFRDPDRWERDALGEILLDESGKPQRQLNPTSYQSQTGQLTELRRADPAWAAVPVEVLRSALQRLERAFKAFFQRCAEGKTPGYPRFRSARRYDSVDFPAVKVLKDRVHVPKLGPVRISLYRPYEGQIKRVTVKRDATGRWWISLACEVGPSPKKAAPDSIGIERTVGIDLGISDLVTLSTGETIPNPRFAREAAKKLAKKQRALNRTQKGSKNRERRRVEVAKAYAHVASQRLDYARKLTKELYDRFDSVFYEDLNLVGLNRSWLSKSFADAAWGILLRCLVSKAEEAGKHACAVDARMTSQLCYRCGTHVPKDLSARMHHCPYCHLTIGRDHNSALVIQRRGLDAFWSQRTLTMKEKPVDPMVGV